MGEVLICPGERGEKGKESGIAGEMRSFRHSRLQFCELEHLPRAFQKQA